MGPKTEHKALAVLTRIDLGERTEICTNKMGNAKDLEDIRNTLFLRDVKCVARPYFKGYTYKNIKVMQDF